MPKTIADIWNLRSRYKEDVGIEVEMEFNPGLRAGDIPPTHELLLTGKAGNSWTTHNDGSLRAGIEFVTAYPIPITDVRASVATLLTKVKNVNFSHRTSVHSHFNVQNMTLLQVSSAVLGWWVFEECVLQLVDPKRRGNQFCLPWTLAEGQVRTFVTDMKEGAHFSYFNADGYKYSAMNLANIPRMGTMEFRALEGTKDVDKITTLITGIHKMLHRFSQFTTPDQMFDYFFDMKDKPDTLVDEFLFELGPLVRDKYKKYKQSLYESMIHISYAAYLDWEKYKKDTPTAKAKHGYNPVGLMDAVMNAPFNQPRPMRMHAIVADDEGDRN